MKHRARNVACLLVCFALAPSPPTSDALTQAQTQTRADAPASSGQTVGGAAAELSEGKRLLRRGKAAQALVRLENALGLFERSKDRGGQAAAHDLLGELYERQGLYPAALEHFRQALKLFAEKAATNEKTKDAARDASSRIPVAVPGAATSASDLVLDLDDYHANLMLSKIGNMLYRVGRYDEARAEFARMKVRKPDTSGLAKSGSAAGTIAKGLGGLLSRDKQVTIPLAPLTAHDVKRRFDIYRQTIIYATHEIGLGRIAYRGADLESARKHFREAIEATKGDLPFVGDLGMSRRFRTAARTALADVTLLEAGRAGAKEPSKLYREAAKLYESAMDGAKKDKRPDLMWPAQRGLGRSRWLLAASEQNQKKADEARDLSLAAYRDALKTIEELRQGALLADEARTTFFATTNDVYQEATAALAETALRHAPGGSGSPLEGRARELAAEAFGVAEQGRARSLLDLLGESGGSITEGIPPDLLKQKQDILERQQELAAQLSGLGLTGEPPSKSPDELEKALEKLQTEYDSVESKIRIANPRYEALVSAKTLPLAEVQQGVLVDDETALLEYSLGDEASYLWAVTRGDVRLFKLPRRAAINEQVSALLQQIVPAAQRRALLAAGGDDAQRGLTLGAAATPPAVLAFAEASHALYKSAVEPAASFFGARRLLVVADGGLAYVPFESLVTDAASAGADYSALAYMIHKNEFVYAPSASVIAAARRQPREVSHTSGAILLVADPVFDAGDPRAGAARATAASNAKGAEVRGLTLGSAVADVSGGAGVENASAGDFKLARLKGTLEEAQHINTAARAAGMRADLWLDLEAKESNVSTRDLRQYRILHFATHGLLNAERPQFTGLVLSLVGDGEADGFLRTNEVFNLSLGRPLVMLSACETGLGREKRGEGVIGLTRAFMYAGAREVGVTLWSVGDRSTAELMTGFYKRLLSKDAPAPSAALREARLEMIKGKKYGAPFHWAAFVLVGDWRE